MLWVYLPVHFTHLTFCQRDVATWSYKEVGPQRIILQPYQPYTILKGGQDSERSVFQMWHGNWYPLCCHETICAKFFPRQLRGLWAKGEKRLLCGVAAAMGQPTLASSCSAMPTHETRIPLKARVKRAKLETIPTILFSWFDGIYSSTRLLFKAIIVDQSLPSLQIHIKEMGWLHIQMYTVSLVYVCQWVCGEVVGHRYLVLHITILQVRDLRPSFMHELSSGSTKVDLLGGRAYLNIFCILLAHIYIYISYVIIHIMIYTTGLSE